MPVVENNIKVQPLKAKKVRKTPRIKHSNWILTINGNKRFDDEDGPEFGPAQQKLKKIIDDMFGDDKIVRYLKVMEDGKNIDDVEKIKVDGGDIEIGPQQRKMHVHIGVMVTHRTLVQLDYMKLRAEFKERYPGVYLQQKFYRDASQDLSYYIHKAGGE